MKYFFNFISIIQNWWRKKETVDSSSPVVTIVFIVIHSFIGLGIIIFIIVYFSFRKKNITMVGVQ